MAVCKECVRPLRSDEIALYKRMINRGAQEYLCISCLAKYFDVEEKVLYEKAEHFRSQGCTLFGEKPDLP